MKLRYAAIALTSLLYASPAMACDSSWVLWVAVKGVDLFPVNAFATKEECHLFVNEVINKEGKPDGALILCLPDSIDPRRPAVKM